MEDLKLIADQLTENGYLVNIKPNSVFAAEVISDAAGKESNEIIKQIALRLRNELMLYKTKINPLLQDYTSRIIEDMSKLRDTSEVSKFNIKEIKVSGFIYNLKDDRYLDDRRTNGMLPNTDLYFQLPTPELLREYFVPKLSGSLKARAAEVLSKYDDVALTTLWNRYLTNISSNNDLLTNLFSKSSISFDELSVIYMALSYLAENKPNYNTMSDAGYKEVMDKAKRAILGAIGNGLAMYDNYLTTKLLVVNIEDNYTIYVHPEVYNDFLKLGGKPELIFGYTYSTRGELSKYVNGMLEKMDEYLKLWTDKVELSRLAAINSNIRSHRSVHSLYVEKFFTDILPADLQQYVTVTKADARGAVDTLIANTKDSDILDIDNMCRKIFGLIYFANTNYYKFTEYMLEQLKINQGISLNKAASYASLDLIIDYLGTQIEITRF